MTFDNVMTLLSDIVCLFFILWIIGIPHELFQMWITAQRVRSARCDRRHICDDEDDDE